MRPTNLLKASLGTTAHCDKVCVDNHGAENLISDDVRARQNGMLLEHFIRPPVDVDFHLPCACDLAYIKLKLARASRAVQRLQIWTQFPNDSNWSRVTTEFNLDSSLVLQCGNILPRYLTPQDQPQESHRTVRSIRGVSKLRITILGMKDCVAVCLIGCEAIGLPSSRVPRDHAIFGKLKTPLNQTSPLVRKPYPSTKSRNEESLKRRRIEDSTDIPEEFLDPITFSIMTIPVALPSGNAVDQSTLDKHVANENRWGRPASDPFTGVALKSKPIVITELKSRIDHFLSATGSTSGVRLADGRNVSRSSVSRLVPESSRTEFSGAPDEPRLSTNMETAFAEALTAARKILNGDYGGLDGKKCAACDRTEVEYKRLCGHCLCRACVSEHAESKCSICGVQSTRSTVVKIHV